MSFFGTVGDYFVSDDGWFDNEHFLYEFEGVTGNKDHFECIKLVFQELSMELEFFEAVLKVDGGSDCTCGGDCKTLYAYKGRVHLTDPLTMNQIRIKVSSDLVLKPYDEDGESGDIAWQLTVVKEV